MKIITNYENLKKRIKRPILAIGNFDGVHLGHQMILRNTVEEAKRVEGTPVALTFQPHPLMVLDPDNAPLLITPFQKKAEQIEKCGIEILVCVSFTKEFSQIRARAFAKDILCGEIGVKEIFVGKNFTFGRGKEGHSDTLMEFGREFGFKVNIVKSFMMDEEIVSSSNIRKLVKKGEVKGAKVLLGRCPSVKGEVIAGSKRGKRLGYPTANLEVKGYLIPYEGIYAAKIRMDKKIYNGVVYIGSNPTFQRNTLFVEVHLFDFDKDIYGKSMEVSFIERIRGEKSFKTEKELINQISKDVEEARIILNTMSERDS